MLKDLVTQLAKTLDKEDAVAREALGVVLNAADRQGAPIAEALFSRLPGARTLAARTGHDHGGSTGVIARLIEQTPGGKRWVAGKMIMDLQALGFSHKDVGDMLPAIANYAEETLGLEGFGHLGDLIGTDMDASPMIEAVAA